MGNKVPKCIMPWLYLEIFPEGTVTPCCGNELELGNIKESSIEEIWNDEIIKKFRLSMFEDELPPSCEVCKQSEKLGAISLREKYNNFFKDSFSEIIDNTNDDGSIQTIKFKGYDFKVSNKCNFKCRMCNPRLSSSFTGEILEHSKELNIDEFLEKNIDHLQLIEFAGGETSLMDEQYYLLEKLIENKKTNIELCYNTNLSVLSYKNKNILDYWNKWNPKKLTILTSIDEIGDRAEYIRKGTKWNTVEKNLKIVSTQKFNRSTNIVVSCFNVFRLPEIIEYLTDINWIHSSFNYMNYDLSLIDGGLENSIYSVYIIPKIIKVKIKKKILSFIDDYNLKYDVDISEKFTHILNALDYEIENDKIFQYKFLVKTLEMDKARKENLFEIIPEFKEILSYWKNNIK
jgi:radical SAM protein with 4Fe4S-binding SPASM domain